MHYTCRAVAELQAMQVWMQPATKSPIPFLSPIYVSCLFANVSVNKEWQKATESFLRTARLRFDSLWLSHWSDESVFTEKKNFSLLIHMEPEAQNKSESCLYIFHNQIKIKK